MARKVTVQPSGNVFDVPEGDTILAAGLAAGFHLPYGCRNGACGSCKGKLVAGEIDYGKYQHTALSEDERAAGYALFCVAKPLTDVTIESREIGAVKDIVVKKLPCRVNRLERVADDVMIVQLKLPASERLQFLAGQYIEFILKDGARRSFSMANAPHDDEFLQIHVRHVPGGSFTEHVFKTMKERDILRFEGPLGSFFLRESEKPIVFVASGTGFAPIKAIIESAFQHGHRPADDALLGRPPAEGSLPRRARRAVDSEQAVAVQVRPGDLGCAAGGPMDRTHRLRPPRGDGRLRPTSPASRSMPAACRSWSSRRAATSPTSAGCRSTSSSPTRSPLKPISQRVERRPHSLEHAPRRTSG